MAYTQLIPQQTKDAGVDEISRATSHYLLSVAAGKSDKYRLAQLDDYAKTARSRFPHSNPVRLNLSARVSSDSIPGTWGFGFWNYPFGMSLGFGGTGWRLPTLPNAVWFFGASEENFLSFQREDTANGFLAQSFRSPSFHPLLVPAGLTLPFSRRSTRHLLAKVIGEDGIQLWSPAARRRFQEQSPGLQEVDPTRWHRYRLDWREEKVAFRVDEVLLFESPVSPNPPLGLVIWIDNQYAAFNPQGEIRFGTLENPEPAWLEVKDIDVQ